MVAIGSASDDAVAAIARRLRPIPFSFVLLLTAVAHIAIAIRAGAGFR